MQVLQQIQPSYDSGLDTRLKQYRLNSASKGAKYLPESPVSCMLQPPPQAEMDLAIATVDSHSALFTSCSRCG